MTLVAPCEIRTALRIAERHIRAVVDQLPDRIRRRDLPARLIDEREPAARNCNAHCSDFFKCILRGQVPHPRRRLCRTIHHDEQFSRPCSVVCKLRMKLRVELAARLRQRTERREIHTKEAEPLQHRVGIGYAGKTCNRLFPHNLPKTAVKERFLRHNNGSADSEVRIQNRKPIDIV